MIDGPYITLSSAISLDGYLDTAEPPRLVLSNDLDRDRVDDVRAQNDAVLVGARTVRLDNPRLLVHSLARQRVREAAGRSSSPWKITATRTGDLDPGAAFFADDGATKLVYCPRSTAPRIRGQLGSGAVVIGLGDEVTMPDLVSDLSDRGVSSLMVEGGGSIHTQFLAANLVDELHLAVAPFFVGDPRAPRFVDGGAFPWTSSRRARLAEVRSLGEIVLLRYAMSDRAVTSQPLSSASLRESLVLGLS
ncbi:MAG: deaminase [Frondihabitans sp.]|nr:deaminase [Frondihabitans sp.]